MVLESWASLCAVTCKIFFFLVHFSPYISFLSLYNTLNSIFSVTYSIVSNKICRLKAGYQVTVYNRSLEKTKPLQELGILFASLLSPLLVLLLSSLSLSFLIHIPLGAKVVSSPLEVAQNSNVVFTILGYPHDVREVVLGNKGVLQVLSPFLSFFYLF